MSAFMPGHAATYTLRRLAMEVKLFEVRDRATFIPCFGILIVPTVSWCLGLKVVHREEKFLIGRAGFAIDDNLMEPHVMFGRLDEGGETQYDPYKWAGRARTLPLAHRYVTKNWKELESGAVIDVEFILGETAEKKESEG